MWAFLFPLNLLLVGQRTPIGFVVLSRVPASHRSPTWLYFAIKNWPTLILDFKSKIKIKISYQVLLYYFDNLGLLVFLPLECGVDPRVVHKNKIL